MNLEVDVMEGDGFGYDDTGRVVQRRNDKSRIIGIGQSLRWFDVVRIEGVEQPIDLPTFTRYCEGCGLTVKEVKPDPQVETIKPPEWGVLFKDNCVSLCQTREVAEDRKQVWGVGTRIVRIDWGAK